MKVKLLTSRAGIDFAQDAGDVIEVSNDEAKRLLESGQAEPVAKKASDKAEKRSS